MKDFIKLYTEVHELHHKLFNTWLSAWEDKNTGLHWLKLGNEEEFSGIIIEGVYQEVLEYLEDYESGKIQEEEAKEKAYRDKVWWDKQTKIA